MQKNMNIKALGQSATIGSFYDSTTNDFSSMSIFKRDITKLIITRDDPTTMCTVDSTNSYSEKFSKFDINGNLKVKLISGLAEIEGAGSYLKEEKTDSNCVKTSIIFKCRTKKDSLNINDTDLVEHFALDNFHNYTHFVTAIKWGADVVVTFEQARNEKSTINNTMLSGGVSDSNYLGKLFESVVDAKGKLNYNNNGSDTTFDSSIKIKINADIPGLNTIPTNMNEVFQLFNDIPSKLKDCNNGKGKPIEYELTSLSIIKKMFKLDSITLYHFYNDLDNNSIDQMVAEFDRFLGDKQKFNFFYEQVKSFKKYITKESITKIEDDYKKLNKKEMSFRKEIFSKLVGIRKSQSSEEMDKLSKDFEESVEKFSEDAMQIIDSSLRIRLENNIDFFKYLINHLNVKILEQNQSVNNLLQTELRGTHLVYILVGKIENRETEDWIETYKIFTNLIDDETKINNNNESDDGKESKKKAFYFADSDIHKNLIEPPLSNHENIILVYKNKIKGYLG